jgi:hypothetical protein
VVDEVHEMRARAARLSENVGRSAQTWQLAQYGLHQFRVAPTKAVDGLLDVADPDGLPGDARQAHEERELDRARVLKLIDQEELELFGQRFDDLGLVEKSEKQVLLIDEIDDTELALSLLIGIQRASGQGKDGVKIRGNVTPQARMGRISTCGFRHGLRDAPQLLLRSGLRELHPRFPLRVAGAHVLRSFAREPDVFGSLLRCRAFRELGKCDLDRSGKCGIQILPARRRKVPE